MGKIHKLADFRRRWGRVARAIKERDSYRCRSCKKPGKLEVHHIIPIEKGGPLFAPDNLLTLCRNCHIELHRGPRRPPTSWEIFRDEIRS